VRHRTRWAGTYLELEAGGSPGQAQAPVSSPPVSVTVPVTFFLSSIQFKNLPIFCRVKFSVIFAERQLNLLSMIWYVTFQLPGSGKVMYVVCCMAHWYLRAQGFISMAGNLG